MTQSQSDCVTAPLKAGTDQAACTEPETRWKILSPIFFFIYSFPTLKVNRFIKVKLHGSVKTEYFPAFQKYVGETDDVIYE